jgi:predicted ATPase/class 3 adenylate cyclase
MFCDMVGSSALSTRLDPEEQREVIAAFHSGCAKEIKALGGMVAQYLGDGVLAYFGYPTAHENDAERAILAGLAILKAIGTLRTSANVAVKTRIAIGSGVVVVGDLMQEGVTQENAAIGETTNLVARLQAIAEPDAIVISPVTHRLVGALFDYRDLGRHTLKGFPEPVHVRQVLGPSKVENRFEARRADVTLPLLGRDEELELLMRRWQQAKRSEGRVVLITGEPGIGKSRLARALQQWLRHELHTSLNYQCSPYHQDSAFYPVIGELTRAAGIEREDAPQDRLNKVEALLAPSGGNLGADTALFAALLSIPGGERYPLPKFAPQRLKELTLRALISRLARLAARQPVLMTFEDLHWLDPTTLELLSLAVAEIKRLRLLMVATARPEFTAPWPSHRHVTTMPLTRLDRKEGQALVAGVTGRKPLPAEVLEQILARTDGVPLFIEELTKTVLESGLLREADGGYELNGPLPPLSIPSTLHASLLARLDRLASVKDVAQIGAVIGREFSYVLIARVAGLAEPGLRAALAQLVATELIYQRGVPPDASYQFKHALVQDAAYSSLVRSRRQQLHGLVAHAHEDGLPEIVATEPETLAHHFTEAGAIEQAVEYWLKAGHRALNQSANIEAATYLTRGIQQINFLPASVERTSQETEFYLALGPAMRAVKGFGAPETLDAFSRAHELIGEEGSQAQQLIVSGGLFSLHLVRAEHSAARKVAEQTLNLATRQGHQQLTVLGMRQMGTTSYFMGEFAEARRYLEQTLELPRTPQEIVPFLEDDHVYALSFLSWTLWCLGYPEQAAAACARSLSRAQDVKHLFTTAMALCTAPLLGVLGAAPREAAAHAEAAVAHAVEHGLTNWENWGRISWATLLSRLGDPRHALQMIQECLGNLDRAGVGFMRPTQLAALASSRSDLGENEAALRIIDEGIDAALKTGERLYEAELCRLRGETLLKVGKVHEADAQLRQALEIAKEQGARWWELRTATTLARHWHSEARYADAYNLLEPVFSWFSEGFDTADLKAAKALLDELSRAGVARSATLSGSP